MSTETGTPEAPAAEYRDYSVTWEIELSACSPQEAAEEALDSMGNYGAKVFVVTDDAGNRTEVDLDEREEEADGRSQY